MDSSYFGEPNMGNERVSGSSSSSSSRKGKKNNQDKSKQPQRGLGVAQLEKIRLHGQMACGGYHPPLHSPYPSNFNNEDPRVQTPYSSVPSSSSSSFSYSSTSYSPSYGFQPNIVDSQHIDTKKHRSGSRGESSQNSESSDTQEPDSELRLSL
ncbi:Protein SPEAR1 [Glycine max]|nr:Protein SPEAR1 [Glycine max]